MKNYALLESTEYANMRELVEICSERYIDRVAYSYRINQRDRKSVKVTYEQFREDVRALGTAFVSRGYKGKHIAVTGKLSYQWICTYYALLAAGAVMVPLDAEWAGEDLAETITFAECSALICDREMKEKYELILEKSGITDHILFNAKEEDEKENWADLVQFGKIALEEGSDIYFENELDPNKLALIVFTSGTTGKGKGVMLTQKMILSDIAEGLKYVEVSPKSISLLPLHHTFGSTVNLLGQFCGGVEVYLSSGIRYVLKELKLEKPTHLILVPLYLETFHRKIMANIKEQGKETLVKNMMKVSNALRKLGIDKRRTFFKSILEAFGGELQFVISGGAPISQDLIDDFDAWGVTVINGYGITECAPLISVNRNKYQVKGSVGLVLPCDEIKIAHPDENGEGEIRVKGPNVMLGYYRDVQSTTEVFDKEGFFRTGDVGKIDDQGALYITGRIKNLIILSNGKNVYPEEIEKVFSGIPGVQDAVVYEGKSKRGVEYNAIVLEVFPDKEYCEANSLTDMQTYLQKFVDDYNRHAVPYKKVGLLKIREEDFPKNTLRKIQRFKMDKTID
ncbi:MAG: AMP-binding protein [Clostridia bacterium]|nr:AMP-binding protein [Clostridia bacterium]